MVFHGFIASPERQQTLGQRLSASVGQGVAGGSKAFAQKIADTQENEALKRLTGQDFSGMTPDMKKEFVKVFTGAHSQRAQEKQQMLETGLGTIQEMRDLIEHAGPSNWIQGLFPGETQQARGKLAQLGTSLIPLAAAGVSIRNQKEFDQYKKVIANPNSTQSQLEGALDGLESIISRQIQNPSSMNGREEIFSERENPVFDISNPSHKKARDALMKKFKGNREKVHKELSKHYREE